jgi:hypothetical protein
MYSSFVQYQTYSLFWSSWGVKNHATSSLFSLFFQHKIYNFFLQKVSEMLRLHSYIRSMKHVKILSYKVTTLHFMTDISIYIYIYRYINIYIRGEAHIQLYVQLICTVPNIQLFLVLLRCKKSHNLFSIFIIFSN